MDIRILIAVGLSLAILLVAWFVFSARKTSARLTEEQERDREEGDRIASKRLSRLAEAQRRIEASLEDETTAGETAFEEASPVEVPETPPGEQEGVPDQIAHRPAIGEDIQPREHWSAILQPTVPLDRDAPLRSWLGGRPHLPAGAQWPTDGGTRLVFFAGIALADIDPRVWHGEGVREGWLLVFLHPGSHAPHCLHVPAIRSGHDERPEAFPQGYELFGPHGMPAQDEQRGSRIPRCFAEWPVTMELRKETGEDDADRGYGPRGTESRERDVFDFADPALHALDEWAMLDILDSINDDFARLQLNRYHDVDKTIEQHRTAVERWRIQLTEALEAETPDQGEIARLRQMLSQSEQLHQGFLEEVETNRAAQAHVVHLSGVVRDHATTRGLSKEEIAQVMEGLAQVPVAILNRSGTVGGEKIELVRRPITKVTPRDLHPGSSMIAVATEHAKQAYTRRPEVFTAEQEAFWVQRFARDAKPLGKIGGFPVGYTGHFDPAKDVVLLELESSSLVGWKFPDTDRLLLTLPRDALREDDFAQAELRIANG